MKTIKLKEIQEINQRIEAAKNSVTIEEVGDSRTGNHSYASYTTYYKASYEGKTCEFKGNGPNSDGWDYKLNLAYALHEVGALDDETYNKIDKKFLYVQRELDLFAEDVAKYYDDNFSEFGNAKTLLQEVGTEKFIEEMYTQEKWTVEGYPEKNELYHVNGLDKNQEVEIPFEITDNFSGLAHFMNTPYLMQIAENGNYMQIYDSMKQISQRHNSDTAIFQLLSSVDRLESCPFHDKDNISYFEIKGTKDVIERRAWATLDSSGYSHRLLEGKAPSYIQSEVEKALDKIKNVADYGKAQTPKFVLNLLENKLNEDIWAHCPEGFSGLKVDYQDHFASFEELNDKNRNKRDEDRLICSVLPVSITVYTGHGTERQPQFGYVEMIPQYNPEICLEVEPEKLNELKQLKHEAEEDYKNSDSYDYDSNQGYYDAISNILKEFTPGGDIENALMEFDDQIGYEWAMVMFKEDIASIKENLLKYSNPGINEPIPNYGSILEQNRDISQRVNTSYAEYYDGYFYGQRDAMSTLYPDMLRENFIEKEQEQTENTVLETDTSNVYEDEEL